MLLLIRRTLYIQQDWLRMKNSPFYIAKARRGLAKLYSEKPNDVVVAFNYAQNLINYGITKKQKQLGTQILECLANREYSDELNNYNKNYEINISSNNKEAGLKR